MTEAIASRPGTPNASSETAALSQLRRQFDRAVVVELGIWAVPSMGAPPNGWFMIINDGGSAARIDDLGVLPPVMETPYDEHQPDMDAGFGIL